MIFDLWLDLPVWGIFGALAAAYALSAALIHRLCFAGGGKPRLQSLTGIVAPFFGSVAVMFSLLTGFLANDVWDRDKQAARTVLAERDGLLSVHAISRATPSNLTELQQAAQHYAQALIEDEWPRMLQQGASDTAGRALLEVLTQASSPQVGIEAGAAAQGALLTSTLRLRGARDDRLALSSNLTDRTKWTAVLLLALITQVAIGIVHLEKPRAQLAALSIFSTAVVVMLGLIAIRERPFDGPAHVSPAPIEQALRIMRSPSPL